MKIGFLHLASRVVAVSDAIRKDSFARALVIGNPYRDKLFRLIPEAPRNKTIAFVGRLVSDKGCDLLLKAFARISKRLEFVKNTRDGFFQPCVTLIGEGPEEDGLRALAAELGLGNIVHFAGRLTGDDLVCLLNEHQILAVPSRWNEPFGIVALEGAACGCVVLGSDAGGLPDAIGKAGLLFKQGDVEDLAEKILAILSSAEMAANLRKQSREHLLAHGEEVVCAKYLTILEDAMRPKLSKTYE
jgi:glycosyltransferase involved in cell wall biosynthesis